MSEETIVWVVKTPAGAEERKEFVGLDEFKKWLAEEKNKWSGFHGKPGDTSSVFQHFQQAVDDKLRPNNNPHPLQRLKEYLGSFPKCGVNSVSYIFFPSWSGIGGRILSSTANPEYAAGVLSFYSTGSFASRLISSEFLKGYFDEYRISLGMTPVPEGLKAEVAEAEKRREERFQPLLARLEKRTGSVEAASKKAEELSAAKQQELADLVSKFDKTADSKFQDFDSRIKQIEDEYRVHMSLKAPVEYWDERCEEHNKSRQCWFSCLLTTSVITMLLLVWYLKRGSGWMPETENKLGIPLHFVGGFIVLASVMFWFIRFSVRQYNNHKFLQQDARERVTMAKTFLALVADEKTRGHVTPKDELVLVLSALFRPAGGSSCDEGPKSFVETAAEIISMRK